MSLETRGQQSSVFLVEACRPLTEPCTFLHHRIETPGCYISGINNALPALLSPQCPNFPYSGTKQLSNVVGAVPFLHRMFCLCLPVRTCANDVYF